MLAPNDPSSATPPTGRVDCNQSARAGFSAAHGWASFSLHAEALMLAVMPNVGTLTTVGAETIRTWKTTVKLLALMEAS